MQQDDEDELEIHASALRRLTAWFDDEDEIEPWAIAQLVSAADEMRLLHEPPASWERIQSAHPRRRTLRFVETTGGPTQMLLLFELAPERVQLRAAWARGVRVTLTRHARERLDERVGASDRSRELRRHWLDATVDRALRNEELSIDAPRWAASAPLKPGFGWITRELAGDEVALLVAAPHRKDGPWNIVTILTRSTAISPAGRIARSWKRGTRRLLNRIRYRKAPPTRARATRPPQLGDVVAPTRRRPRRR